MCTSSSDSEAMQRKSQTRLFTSALLEASRAIMGAISGSGSTAWDDTISGILVRHRTNLKEDYMVITTSYTPTLLLI